MRVPVTVLSIVTLVGAGIAFGVAMTSGTPAGLFGQTPVLAAQAQAGRGQAPTAARGQAARGSGGCSRRGRWPGHSASIRWQA